MDDREGASKQPSLADNMKNCKQKDVLTYKNVDFVCGSAVEVEWVWSVCKHMLTNVRSKPTSILFEALVFLKAKDSFWGIATVQEACGNVMQEQRRAGLAKWLAEDLEHLWLNKQKVC